MKATKVLFHIIRAGRFHRSATSLTALGGKHLLVQQERTSEPLFQGRKKPGKALWRDDVAERSKFPAEFPVCLQGMCQVTPTAAPSRHSEGEAAHTSVVITDANSGNAAKSVSET